MRLREDLHDLSINLQKRFQETIGCYFFLYEPIICLLIMRFLELISWVVKVRARQVWPREHEGARAFARTR